MQEKHTKYVSFDSTIDFMKAFTDIINLRKELTKSLKQENATGNEQISTTTSKDYLSNPITDNYYSNLQKMYENLKREFSIKEKDLEHTQNELDNYKRMSLGNNKTFDVIKTISKETITNDKEIQMNIENENKSTATDFVINEIESTKLNDIKDPSSLEVQLTKALDLASERNSMILNLESRLSEAQSQIKIFEFQLEEKNNLLKDLKGTQTTKEFINFDKSNNIKINSMQKLMLEKETILQRYQELLKNERLQQMKIFEESQKEIKQLKGTIFELEKKLNDRLIKNTNTEETNNKEIINSSSNQQEDGAEKMDSIEKDVIFERKLKELNEKIENLERSLADARARENDLEQNSNKKSNEIELLNRK